MAVAALLAGAAERHLLEDRDVVADDRRLADDDAGAVIDEDAVADRHGGVDVDAEHFRDAALQEGGDVAPAAAMERVADPVPFEGMEALVIEGGLGIALGRRVARADRHKIGECRADDRGVFRDCGAGQRFEAVG